MIGHILEVKKKRAETATRNTRETQKIVRTKYKRLTKAYTHIAPVHRDEFYTNPGNHLSFTLGPTPPATTKREGIRQIRFL